MLHGNESISTYSPGNLTIWFIMAFQAGLLNIGGFMAGHQIVSHITGLATFFGSAISHRDFEKALMLLLLPLFFLFGAMISGYFVDIRIRQNKRPKYYITFTIMFLLTLCVFAGGMAGSFGAWGSPDGGPVLISLLCLICGIQNGTVTVVSKSIIRTTHLTGITTDLGIGLVRILYKNKIQQHSPNEEKANFVRCGLIFYFVLGSAIGGLLFERLEYLGFLLPVLISGTLLVLMLYFQVWKK